MGPYRDWIAVYMVMHGAAVPADRSSGLRFPIVHRSTVGAGMHATGYRGIDCLTQ